MADGGGGDISIITNYRQANGIIQDLQYIRLLQERLLTILSFQINWVDMWKTEVLTALENAEGNISAVLDYIHSIWANLSEQQRRGYLSMLTEKCRHQFSVLRAMHELHHSGISRGNLETLVTEFLNIQPITAIHVQGQTTVRFLWTKLISEIDERSQLLNLLNGKEREVEDAIQLVSDPERPDLQRFRHLELLNSRVAVVFVGLKIALVFR